MTDPINHLAEILIDDLGGAPVARHNFPCAVCRSEKAVLQLDTGIFHPCWTCQRKGWDLVHRSRFAKWWRKLMTRLGS